MGQVLLLLDVPGIVVGGCTGGVGVNLVYLLQGTIYWYTDDE